MPRSRQYVTLSDLCGIYFTLSNWISQPGHFVRRLKYMHWTSVYGVNIRHISHFVDLLSSHTLKSAIDCAVLIPTLPVSLLLSHVRLASTVDYQRYCVDMDHSSNVYACQDRYNCNII